MDEKLIETVERVYHSESWIFSDLVRTAGLDPRETFWGANLQDVDFTRSDLSDFDFSFADLRGAKWGGIAAFPKRFDRSLRGHRRVPIYSHDFEQISGCVKSGKTWSERFLFFALLVDGFGLVDETLSVLKTVVSTDDSEYMRACSYAYFCAVALKSNEAEIYCRGMAGYSNSYGNMYRIKRIRRYIKDFNSYLNSVQVDISYPGAVSSFDILNCYSFWQIGVNS